ncbi:MAG: hypothetical protein RLZ75_1726, partial [Pseudomonadota bacterium]
MTKNQLEPQSRLNSRKENKRLSVFSEEY